MRKHNVITRVAAHTYDFYLSTEIGHPSSYIGWLDTMRNAAEEDTIVIHINTPGGSVFTALQVMRAMSETRAHIVTSIEGECCSAATFIFLAGDTFEISPHSAFLIHDYSGVVHGEGHKIASQVAFDKIWFDKLVKDVYRNFLSPDEISRVLLGHDLWLTDEQVSERCVRLQEARIAAHREKTSNNTES